MSVVDLATLGRRQNALESGQSAIEAALSAVQCDVLSLRSAQESVNRAEREETELAVEVQSVRSASEVLSRPEEGRKSGSLASQEKSLH
jgi:hypothetical protein